MEKNYMEYIRNFLAGLEPLVPVPAGISPDLRESYSLKAYIFDVYGTLLISDSGDVDESVVSSENLRRAMKFSDISVMGNASSQDRILNTMLEEFVREIKVFHLQHRTAEKPYPEIDIEHIWETIIMRNHARGSIQLNGDKCIKCMTFIFEILSNPLYPMPGMKEVIKTLHSRNIPLGIVSNAQFYTPVVLNYFLSDRLAEDDFVDFFDPDLTIFSYKYKRSKPDLFLFQVLATVLEKKYGLQPADVLFVGNDMQKDVYTGHITGFRTALFAGDTKSLRLREDIEPVRKTRPDYIITDLRQLLNLKH
ncbi:MAG: HAD family hydrolase [Bacteroidales bacterium]|nr:HAD family hydrolase [Bacteroidales bacterium]